MHGAGGTHDAVRGASADGRTTVGSTEDLPPAAVNWLSAFLVAQFFLSLVDAIGESTTFFLFAALCVVSFVFVWRLVPETKGRSLEEIQERWVVGGDKMLDEETA